MNLSVLVATCDLYSKLWPNFLTCFNKYWEPSTNVLFVGETLVVPNYPTYIPGLCIPWGARMLGALENCAENVFFIFEDYYLAEKLHIERIQKYLDAVEKHNMNRLQISPLDKGYNYQHYGEGISEYKEILTTGNYIISCQPSIWKREWLKKTIQPHYSPWDFEIVGSRKLVNQETRTYITEVKKPIYFNAVRRGFRKSKGWEEFRKREKLSDF